MPADYPAALHGFIDTTGKAGQPLSDQHVPAHVELATELAAVQAELGVNPSGAYATVAARLSAYGGVQFVVGRVGTSTNLPASAMVTYPLDGTPTTNIGGGTWDGGAYIYTIPADGLYLCLGGVRMSDGAGSRSLAIGIGTTNADGPHVLWQQAGGVQRQGVQYTRMVRFAPGDQVRLYIYSGGATFPTFYQSVASGQYMAITKVAD